MKGPVRIALLDDHPAIRAGFEAIVALEPDLRVVGFAASEAELRRILRRTCPDVVVLDLHHPGRGGLELCLQVKRRPRAPAVVLYTASADDALGIAAALAGAGALVSKSSPAAVLVDAIRATARAPHALPPVCWRMRREVASRIDAADHAILAMRLAGDPPDEIGDTLRLPSPTIRDRIGGIIAQIERLASAA